MPSIITALAVLGAAVLPDGSNAAIPNGWAAQVTLPDDGVSTFDPTKITLTVQDYGYDSAGNLLIPGVGGPVRTITGTAIIRKQQPNQAQRLNSASAGTRTVYFGLSDYIYAGSTISAASASAGYYGGAAAGSIGGVTNGSTLTYVRPLAGFNNIQHVRATGTGLNVELVAYHRHARNGQQVACVQFQAKDSQATPNATAVQTVSAPALSSLQTQGQIVEAWKATIPLAALTQGDLCYVNAIVYPWIGDASAVLDLSDPTKGGIAPTGQVSTPQPATRLRFVCDKTGGYGGGIAYVKNGGTLAGTSTAGVFTAQQTGLGNAQCYPTPATAIAALKLWNNGNKGHSDHSGSTVYLMDNAGAAFGHALDDSSATASGKCWTDIRVDPNATAAVRLTITGLIQLSPLIRICCPIFINTTGNAAIYNTSLVAFDSGWTLQYGAVPPTGLTFQTPIAYYRNGQVLGSNAPSPFYTFGNRANAAALVLGCTGTVQGPAVPYIFVGNSFSELYVSEFDSANTTAVSQDGAIVANNVLANVGNVCSIGSQRGIDGFACVQNVFEAASKIVANTGSAPVWNFGMDGGGVNPLGNLIIFHNTMPGVGIGGSNVGRVNIAYNNVDGSVGIQKYVVERFNIFHQRNIKTDTYRVLSTLSGRTGNWRVRYGVGALGNVVVTGDANGSTVADPSGGNWLGEYLEPGSAWGAGEANMVFVDNKSGTTGAGGGNYRLANAGGGTFAARGRVPAGQSALKFDLAGVARKTDGAGAAGAFERTEI